MLATVLGIPLQVPQAGDFGAALGAARLGLMAATGVGTEIAKPPPIARTIDPETRLAAAFADAHQRYQDAYKTLKDL
jgi:xylulokinase